MPDLYANKKTTEGMMDPIALQGRHVVLHYLENLFYRKIDFFETIAPFQCLDVCTAIGAALAAQTTSARTNIVNLELPDDEFGQFRWYVIDNAQIRLFLPGGVAKSNLRWIQATFDANTPLRDPNLVSSEIFIWEDNRPAVEAINFNDYNLTAVRIVAMGYRYHTVKSDDATQARIKADPNLATHIWCTGRGQG